MKSFFSKAAFARRTLSLFLLLGALIALIGNSPAQTETETQTIDLDRMVQGWEAELNQIESATGREGVSDGELISFRDRLGTIRADGEVFATTLRPEIESLNAQLTKLTSAGLEPPAEETAEESNGQPEVQPEEPPSETDTTNGNLPANGEENAPASTAAEQALNDQKTSLEAALSLARARLGRTEVVLLRSNELADRIKQLRRDKFTSQLLSHSRSILDPVLWLSGVREFPWMLRGFVNVVEGGTKRILDEAFIPFVVSFGLSLLFLVLLLTQWKGLQYSPVGPEGQSRPIGKELNAIKRVFRYLLIFTLVPAVVLFTLEQSAALAPRLSEFLWSTLDTVFYFALAVGLARAIFSSGRPEIRLIDMSDQDARTYERLVIVCTSIALVGSIILHLSKAMVASLDVTVLIYGAMAMAFTIAAFLTRRKRRLEEAVADIYVPQILVLRIIGGFVVIAFLTAFFAPLAGYAFLGAFSVNQVILAGIIAGILYLFFRLMDGFAGYDEDQNAAGVPVIRASDAQHRRKAQALLLINGLVKIILILFGLIVIAASWGIDTTGFWGDFVGIFSGFKIGELTISPAVLLTAIIILILGILLTRALKKWFANRLLPTTNLDVGLRNSITTAIGYLGYLVAAMVAFSQAGLDLSNLAIVAGALSLGIGFGLQSIVSNFVSGIILLAERPIKAGDWIEVGGEQGTVKKISVRSTEIETFDRATVIVPNADFISGSVKNMMYGNTIGRFIVAVGVGYDSDPDQVRDILLDCAKEHPLVLSYPGSYVIFSEFGASSLDFELRGYIADCGDGLGVRSDLRFAILRRFREEGIEIPFPQRDLNLKKVETVLANELSQDDAMSELTEQTSGNHDETILDKDE